ncbi:MAG: hypothetical protein N3D11_00675 [Candidatus Sumerlaeia bacterium]|nr:hypothetical protein [Candidatus Sumerlaeia bacterium]
MVASDRQTIFWNASISTLLRSRVGHTGALTGAALSTNGSRLVTGAEDGAADEEPPGTHLVATPKSARLRIYGPASAALPWNRME